MHNLMNVGTMEGIGSAWFLICMFVLFGATGWWPIPYSFVVDERIDNGYRIQLIPPFFDLCQKRSH